ncbi:MAG: hydrogenase maturation protease [Phycisphaerae bacterium]|nr:hydrogenase maturation protease [Phycisphaerae bacterium]
MSGSPQHLHRKTGAAQSSITETPSGIDTVEHLVEHLAGVVGPSTAIVCIGNELCGDDGAGVAIAHKLKQIVPWALYDAQTVPESFLMKIASRKPESVVLIDALDFGAPPGSVEMIEAERIGGQGPSTHGPAPLAFLEVLGMIHPCRCAVLGIQPQRADIGTMLSEPVLAAIDRVVEAFRILAESTS